MKHRFDSYPACKQPIQNSKINRLQYHYSTQYDVGVDNNNFTPVSYEQVRKIIEKQIIENKQ